MTSLASRGAVTAMIAMMAAGAAGPQGNGWTNPVDVVHNDERCVTYRARLEGEHLVVQATHEAGWHTYAMDNKRRAEEKLAGKRSLGIDQPTEIALSGGLELAGPWYQSPPKDLSKPDLNWFSWGFEGQALFVAKVRRSRAAPAQIAIRGQACTDVNCKNIDLTIPLSPPRLAKAVVGSAIDFKSLVPVR